MRVSFVVCGNGYGHLRRALQVAAKVMEDDGAHVIQVIGATTHESMFQTWTGEMGIRGHVSFVNGRTENNVRVGLPADYSLSDYSMSLGLIGEKLALFEPDRVVSDNLVGVLRERKDTILMGSFFWGDVLTGKPVIEEIARFENELLRQHTPEMIGVEDIAMPGVRERTRFTGLPWFCEPYPAGLKDDALKSGRQVLVTGGGTNVLGTILEPLATELAADSRLQVFVDKKLGEANPALRQFSFASRDFQQLDWIICRPGAGILTEAVRYRIPLCTLADDNIEINHNAKCVERLGIGFPYQDWESARRLMLDNCSADYSAAFNALKTGGSAMAARHVLNLR